jgi:hypothetical protein
MRKSIPILLSVTVLLTVSLACGLPSIPVTGPTMDANALGTAIMQTMIVAATQTGAAVLPIDIVSSSTPTLTLEPSLTPSATLSPTPLFTNTPLVPLVMVSKDTNCRVGPGIVYDRIGALMVGETAEVLGRDPTGRYWYIKNPDKNNGYCWLWGEYATMSGNTGVLPVYTPPATPTPAPNFEARFDGLESCVSWWLNIELTNTGGIAFQSISLTIQDMQTDAELSLYAEEFTAKDGCHGSSTKDVLNPEERFTVSTPAFAEDPNGHKMRATITLCSAPGQKGMCVTKVIKFTP